MDDKITSLYLKSMIGAIYKILAMYDNQDKTLPEYLDSLCIQLIGSMENFLPLKTSAKYLSIINVVQYFRTHEIDKRTCKREVLKCTNILEKLSKQQWQEVDYGN